LTTGSDDLPLALEYIIGISVLGAVLVAIACCCICRRRKGSMRNSHMEMGSV
jgi:hypothetical protein